MPPVDFILKWSGHGSCLSAVLKNLREDNTLVDCTLAAEGQKLRAHKLILSACSPYFELLFKDVEGNHPIVILKDVSFQELKAIVDYIYCGEVGIPHQQIGSFFKTAGSLQIKELAGASVRQISVPSEGNLVDQYGNPIRADVASASFDRQIAGHCDDTVPQFEFVAVDNDSDNCQMACAESALGLPSDPGPLAGVPVPDFSAAVDSIAISSLVPRSQEGVLSAERGGQSSNTQAAAPASLALNSPQVKTVVKKEPVDVVEEEIEDPEANEEGSGPGEAFPRRETDSQLSASHQHAVSDSASTARPVHEAPAEGSGQAANGDSTRAGAEGVTTRPKNQLRKFLGKRPKVSNRCSLCQRRFATAARLARHIHDHTVENAFECHICGQRFARLSSLYGHQSIHAKQQARGLAPRTQPVRAQMETQKQPAEEPAQAASEAAEGSTEVADSALVNSTPAKHECPTCHKAFLESWRLRRHLAVHAAPRMHTCNICGKDFYHSSSLSRHITQHRKRTVNASAGQDVHPAQKKPSTALAESGDVQAAAAVAADVIQEVSMSAAAKLKKRFPCSHCDKSFAKAIYLKTHSVIHTGARPYQCLNCGKSFKYSSSLSSHRRLHRGSILPQGSASMLETVDIVPEESPSASSVNEGNQVAMRQEENVDRRHHCLRCNKFFQTSSLLKRHSVLHTGEKPYKCRVCRKGFSRSDYVTAHMLTHKSQKLLNMHHTASPPAFKLQKHPEMHFPLQPKASAASTGVTEGDAEQFAIPPLPAAPKVHECPDCGKVFTNRSNMYRHRKRSHARKLHHCEQCGAGFTLRSNLSRHRRKHKLVEGLKQANRCLRCGTTFARVFDLKHHRCARTFEHPCDCEVCGMTFRNSFKLSRHMMSHSGWRPHSCGTCGMTFKRKDHLTRHMRRVTSCAGGIS